MAWNDIIPPKVLKPTIISALFWAVVFLKEPFVSPLAEQVIGNPTLLSIVFGAMPFTILFFSPLIGSLADKIGRKKIIFFGLVCQVFAIFFYMVSSQFWHIFVGKMFDALSYTSVGLISMAKIQDKIKVSRGLMTGIYLSITQVGVALSPLVGAMIAEEYFLRFVFYIAFDCALALMLFALLTYSSQSTETLRGKKFEFIGPLKKFLNHSSLRGMAILGICAHIAQPGWQLFLPLFILNEIGLTYEAVGIVFFCLGLFKCLQFIGGYLSDYVGSKSMIYVGLVLQSLALFTISRSYDLVTTAASVLFLSFGLSLWNTSAWSFMSSIGQKYKFQGTLMGSYLSIAKVGGIVSFMTSGLLVSFIGIRAIYVVYAGIVLLGCLLSMPYMRPKSV